MQRNPSMRFRAILALCLGTLLGGMRLSPGQLSGLGLRQGPVAVKFDITNRSTGRVQRRGIRA